MKLLPVIVVRCYSLPNSSLMFRLTEETPNAPIWTPPVVQEEMKEWATGIGLHVSIRLVSPLADSSPEGNPPANSPYAQRSRSGPEAVAGWGCVGLTSGPSPALSCSQWEVVSIGGARVCSSCPSASGLRPPRDPPARPPVRPTESGPASPPRPRRRCCRPAAGAALRPRDSWDPSAWPCAVSPPGPHESTACATTPCLVC